MIKPSHCGFIHSAAGHWRYPHNAIISDYCNDLWHIYWCPNDIWGLQNDFVGNLYTYSHRNFVCSIPVHLRRCRSTSKCETHTCQTPVTAALCSALIAHTLFQKNSYRKKNFFCCCAHHLYAMNNNCVFTVHAHTKSVPPRPAACAHQLAAGTSQCAI